MRLLILIFLVVGLLPLLTEAQPLTLNDPAMLLHNPSPSNSSQSNSALGFYPTSVSNVAAFWNYHDLPFGTVNAWTDEMPAQIVWTNWATTYVDPTNTGMGLFFFNSGMTNNTFSTASNFSVWMVLAMANPPTNYSQFVGALANNTTNIQFDNSAEINGYWGSAYLWTNLFGFCGQEFGAWSGGEIFYPPLWNDVLDSQGSIYLNGAATSGNIGQPTQTFSWAALANNNDVGTGEPFNGYVKYLLVSTNHAITAAEAANLYAWDMTNGVTNVSGGCIGWWKFNDNESGSTIADSSGHGWTGNLVNSPAWTTGLNSVVNQALTFNGTTQTANIPVTASSFIPLPGQGITISAWVNYTSGDGNGGSSFIMGCANVTQFVGGENVKENLTAAQGFQILQDGDANIRGELNSGNGNESEGNTMAANDGQWHHMVFASDGTNIFSWFDGIRNYQGTLIGTSTGGEAARGTEGSASWLTGLTNVAFSAPSASVSEWEPCSLTDVRIYNRILNDAEVDILYRAPTVDAIIGAYNY